VAKKKRRRRPSGRPPAGLADRSTGTQTRERGVSETAAVRRERKEEVRQARQVALRRYRRQRMVRRGLVWGAGAVAIVLALYFLQRSGASGSGSLTKLTTNTAAAAGCTALEKPEDQGRAHIPSGGSYTYQQQPPTSGPHDPSPLPAGVYTTPQPETRVVHSLEHGAVLFTYESSGPNALSTDVVAALKSVANGNGRVIMAPTQEALSAPIDGKSFTPSAAFAAWDRLIQCPGTITTTQAKVLAQGWVAAFVNASSAPEKGFPL
jgi:Protein of unknown function (DUF3105)